ncbi:hypothetical protein B0T24DRAFT_720290 [Lasiosphaeria ovina]|uniref:Uncharacterized protein n=1 Tax=Lasiosphaeria ovina TaxID=92902 RepID=A0AAE0KCI1_9PEZI|nr:hypothetical protein B0T24DRAFT_720290 [Lasiosphaeria ovina]
MRSFKYIDDLPSPLRRPQNSSTQNEKADPAANDYGVDVAPGTQTVASFRVQRERDIDAVKSASAAVSWIQWNESDDGDQPREAARILHYRASLAYLSENMIRAAEERWNTQVRAMAKQLQKAMQEAAEYIFSDMALLKGWTEARSLVWSTTCHLHGRPTPADVGTTSAERVQSQPILFSMHHNAGLWEISECELEAALGLWYWSVGQLEGADRISRSKFGRRHVRGT